MLIYFHCSIGSIRIEIFDILVCTSGILQWVLFEIEVDNLFFEVSRCPYREWDNLVSFRLAIRLWRILIIWVVSDILHYEIEHRVIRHYEYLAFQIRPAEAFQIIPLNCWSHRTLVFIERANKSYGFRTVGDQTWGLIRAGTQCIFSRKYSCTYRYHCACQ